MYNEYRQTMDTVIERYNCKHAFTYMRNDGSTDNVRFCDIGNFIKKAEFEYKKLGLVSGDRVAIVSPHSPWAVFHGMALTHAGITIVLIDASLPQEEIKRLIVFSDVRAVFTTNRIYTVFELEIQQIPCFSLEQGLEVVPFHKENTNCSKVLSAVERDCDVIAILYSSGTTGEMKGIMVTYESVLKARVVFERLAGLQDYMTYLLVLPFNHIAGFTGAMTFFLTGCEIGFIEDVNSSKLQAGLLNFQPHYFAMVPKVYEVIEQKIRAAIQEQGKSAEKLMNVLFKVSGFLRKNFGINIGRKLFKNITKQVFGENIFGIGTGASPCKEETTKFFLDLGLEWANLYATTETSVPIVATGVHDRYPVGTVGKVDFHPEIKVRINNPDKDGIGEILVKSALMMKGYFRRPDLTEAAFVDGFFRTGDYGFVDKKGYLHITGRIKESIVLKSGKKISPSDVDDYYMDRLPEYDIASRGIVDTEGLCDEIHMFIQDKNYTQDEKKNIMEDFEKISREAPEMYRLSKIHFVAKIPRTSVGKVKRFCLNAENEERVSNKNESLETTEKVFDSIQFQIIKILQKDCKVTLEMRLKEDLGMDSLNIFELCVALDKKYGISVETQLYEGIKVAEIVDIIENRGLRTADEDLLKYPLERSSRDYKWFDWFMKLSKKIWNFNITGAENITPTEKYIFCPNHESYFDGMWIIGSLDPRIRQNICSMAADSLFKKRLYRRGLVCMGGVPVQRNGNTAPALKRAYECIVNEGRSLLIHPEGTRSRTGEMGKFLLGAAKLSIDSGVKIVPICISGAYEIFPPYRKIPRVYNLKKLKKYSINICVGNAIEFKGKTEIQITEEIRQQIVDMKKKYITSNEKLRS